MDNPSVREILFAYSEDIRLRIILLLDKDSSLCVNCIVSALNLPQPTVSRHLALLRRTGIVEAKKDRLHCYYSLSGGGRLGALKKELARTFRSALKDMPPYRADIQRLDKMRVSCDADCVVAKKSA